MLHHNSRGYRQPRGGMQRCNTLVQVPWTLVTLDLGGVLRGYGPSVSNLQLSTPTERRFFQCSQSVNTFQCPRSLR